MNRPRSSDDGASPAPSRRQAAPGLRPGAAASAILVAAVSILGWGTPSAAAAHQTATFSEVAVGREAELPFTIEIREASWPAVVERPTLHSFAVARHGSEWLLLGGRTQGRHGLTGNNAFPASGANRDLWVLDPSAGASWSRSLDDAASGLSLFVRDALASTNQNFTQIGDRLVVAGGYGIDSAAGDFTTFDHLTSIDVPALIAWIKRAAPPGGDAADAVDTIRGETFRVTGGALWELGDRLFLVVGQNYEGRYRPHFNGTYTRQARWFRIDPDAPGLVVVPGSIGATPVRDFLRRRDLNVMPFLEPADPGGGGDEWRERLVALSGVFTPTDGVWTVPVFFDGDGSFDQPNPDAPDTLRQGLQHYHCAKIGLYSQAAGTMHLLQFGGLSAQVVDPGTGETTADDLVPFVHHVTDIVAAPGAPMVQYLLDAEFPDIRDATGDRLFFGTNAEFLPAPDSTLLREGVIDLDAVTSERRLGWIFGGIASDAPNNGNTIASEHLFEVILAPRAGMITPPAVMLEFTGDGILLRWASEEGALYQWEGSVDLGSWQDEGPAFTGTGDEMNLALPLTGLRRYYRLRFSLPSAAGEPPS